MSVLAFSRGGVGPALWRNYRWSWRYADPDVDYSAVEIDIVLNKVDADPPASVALTHASTGVTRANGYIDCDQLGTWVAANLSEGTWQVILSGDKAVLAWWEFPVVTPEGGAITP
jgi:hypothetical protein